MGIDVTKNCIRAADGNMYCWDADKELGYRIKELNFDEMPKDAVVGLLNFMGNTDGKKKVKP